MRENNISIHGELNVSGVKGAYGILRIVFDV
jgi:hypothetical protein